MTKRCSWLLLLCVVACQTDPSSDDKPPLTREQLLNPESCKDCHSKHYSEWSGSMHAYASKDPVFRAMNKRGQEETNGALGDFCVNCHAPMAVREHAISDFADLEAVPEPLQGVTCYFCHNAVSVGEEHVNANITLGNDNIMRAALVNALEPTAHRVKRSVNHSPSNLESSIMCGTCHDIKTPAGVRLERTLEEYQATIFAQADMRLFNSCQDCHMRSSSRTQPAADSTGRMGESVKARTLHEHLWAAVDVPLSDFPHAEALRSAVETCELQSRSITSFHDVMLTQAPGFPFTFRLETEAGHMQPSGAAQDRRMWVEAIVYDKDDKEIWRLGQIADGEVEETSDKKHPCMFRDHIYDAAGTEVHMFWEAASHDKDFLLKPPPPGGNLMPGGHTQICTFNPRLDQPAARIQLRVRMRPMGVDVLQDLVKSGHLDAEIAARMPTFTVSTFNARFDSKLFAYAVLQEPSEGDCTTYRCMLDPMDVGCK